MAIARAAFNRGLELRMFFAKVSNAVRLRQLNVASRTAPRKTNHAVAVCTEDIAWMHSMIGSAPNQQ